MTVTALYAGWRNAGPLLYSQAERSLNILVTLIGTFIWNVI